MKNYDIKTLLNLKRKMDKLSHDLSIYSPIEYLINPSIFSVLAIGFFFGIYSGIEFGAFKFHK